jgi:hypothetical protein
VTRAETAPVTLVATRHSRSDGEDCVEVKRGTQQRFPKKVFCMLQKRSDTY